MSSNQYVSEGNLWVCIPVSLCVWEVKSDIREEAHRCLTFSRIHRSDCVCDFLLLANTWGSIYESENILILIKK